MHCQFSEADDFSMFQVLHFEKEHESEKNGLEAVWHEVKPREFPFINMCNLQIKCYASSVIPHRVNKRDSELEITFWKRKRDQGIKLIVFVGLYRCIM